MGKIGNGGKLHNDYKSFSLINLTHAPANQIDIDCDTQQTLDIAPFQGLNYDNIDFMDVKNPLSHDIYIFITGIGIEWSRIGIMVRTLHVDP